MGYNNDQFFNLNKSTTNEQNNYSLQSNGSRTAGWNTLADNPEFNYPARVARAINQDGKLDTIPLKRGYIRSLTSQAGLATIPIKKCQFQFNPQNLTQSVSQNTSMLNFLQQDPAQYAQPMMGNVNFTFDLFFDRSMELNNAESLAATAINELNPWETGHPSQVGVLRDLAALYAVIGQGMAEYQSEYVKQALEQTVTVEANTATDAGDTSSAASGADAISKIPNFLANNMGNSAFLLPMPIRAVFSSLYIVEGLVTDTTVVYTKFNTAYVPMQAAVSITMEAKYIGFAQSRTFLTYVLEERANEEIRQASVENETKIALGDIVTSLSMEVDEGVSGVNKEFRIQARMPTAATASEDGVDALLKAGTITGIEISATMSAYGPVDDDALDFANITPALLSYYAIREFGTGGQAFQCSITPDDQGARATNSDEWDNMVDGAEGSDVVSSFGVEDDLDGQGMIYHYTVTVTTSTGGANPVVGTGEVWTYTGGDFTDAVSVPITWPATVSIPSSTGGGGTVAPDNGASVVSRTQPGSSSRVGSGGGSGSDRLT